MIITANSICVYSVFIICCSDCSQFRKKWDIILAKRPRVGKLQRWLPGVEYLLWVVHKVDNQQMHKSLQLNFTRALQTAPQSFIHLLLILWLYLCPRHVPKLFWSFWPLNLSLLSWLLLNRQGSPHPGLHGAGLAGASLLCLPNFFHVAIPFSHGPLASDK